MKAPRPPCGQNRMPLGEKDVTQNLMPDGVCDFHVGAALQVCDSWEPDSS